MDTIKIYKNYGVLAAEKRNIYTYGCEAATAICSDEMTVKIPEGWELYENDFGKFVESPWGWRYDINDVLCGNQYPHFEAINKDGKMNRYRLEEV